MPELEKPGLEEGWYWARRGGPWTPMYVFDEGRLISSKDLVWDIAFDGVEIGPRLHPPQESPANQQKGREG